MATKFTPGPWSVCADRAYVDGPDGKVVAHCCYERHPSEEYANADLIAAAPDLYEALEAFIAGADTGYISVDVDKFARAALARARGES